MEWSEGYSADIDYTVEHFKDQSPAHMSFACLLAGVEPVDCGAAFNYFELGFGMGLTLNVLAASNPQGNFFGNDFQPAQVASARELASAANLPNLTLLENSFADLAEGRVDLPQFDYITLHGIYTWVSDANRRHVTDFVARYLKPGGLVYVSYNALPGWNAALPLYHLLRTHAAEHPGRSDVQFAGARDFVKQMRDLGASYFNANPALQPQLASLVEGDPRYLVHEYMHDGWRPFYHDEVARAMGAAKLDYVGSADLTSPLRKASLGRREAEFLGSVADPALRETYADFFCNTHFRQDVYVRGVRAIEPSRVAEWMHRFGLALPAPTAPAGLALQNPGSDRISLESSPSREILAALAAGPRTLAELALLAGEPDPVILRQAARLCANGIAALYPVECAGMPSTTAGRMNLAIARDSRRRNRYDVLAAPLLGRAVPAGFVERQVYLLHAEGAALRDPCAVAARVLAAIEGIGKRMLDERGAPCQSGEEALGRLVPVAKSIYEKTFPIWRQLRIV